MSYGNRWNSFKNTWKLTPDEKSATTEVQRKAGGRFTVEIDASDLELVREHIWYVYPHRNTYYAATKIPAPTQSGHTKLLLHRLLMPEAKGIDHIDRNGLNNRRGNLRPATAVQNEANSSARPSNTSGYKGVTPYRSRWKAQITIDGTNHHLGVFDQPEDAARAYDVAARKAFGVYAKFNFPEDA